MKVGKGSFVYLGFALVIASVALLSFSISRHDQASAQVASQIARGRYLVTAGACAECHTQRKGGDPTVLDQTKFLAGGERFDLPFGTIYSKNLTLDNETGIGTWTTDEIKKAIRDGLSKDGTKLVLMPWEVFHGMADSDLDAMAAYLKTVTPVKNAVPKADLKAPRDGLYADAAKAAAPLGPTSPPTLNPIDEGKYLTTYVLGCTGCHGANLAGGTPPFFAPNLTPDDTTGLGKWAVTEIVTAIRTGVRPTGRPISPVMPIATAFTNLTDSDATKVASYLKTLKPLNQPVRQPPGAPPASGPVTGDFSPSPYLLFGMAGVGLAMAMAGFVLRRRLKSR